MIKLTCFAREASSCIPVHKCIHFPGEGRKGALREGLAITFWLLGMNCAASCRREERRGEAVDFLSLRGGLKRVKEKRAAQEGALKNHCSPYRGCQKCGPQGPRFGEFFPCYCLPLLPHTARKILATWCPLIWRPLYFRSKLEEGS